MAKELLFSVTADDCRFDYYRGSGAGGQKRNKTSSAVRCTHLASGAVGQAEDHRSQHENKRLAFIRMAETRKFKGWHRTEIARLTGELAEIETRVDTAMRDHNLLVEKKVDGLWKPFDSEA
jgi:protein subunit release factor B